MQCRLCSNVVLNPGLAFLNLGSRLLRLIQTRVLDLDFLRSPYATEPAYTLKDSLMASDNNIKIREIIVNL